MMMFENMGHGSRGRTHIVPTHMEKMMIRHTFKVRKDKNSDPVTFTIELPTDIGETELIEARYGTVERMMDRANSQTVVDVAVGMRKRMPDNDRAQQYADAFKNDGRKDSFAPRKLDAEKAKTEAGFDEDQIAWLRSEGHIQ